MLASPHDRSSLPASKRHAAIGPAVDVGRPLRDWLLERALPMWSRVGVDRESGGFFEKIDLLGHPVEEPRRARVVARQIYVFATAARRGWCDGADQLVEHGLRFLRERLRTPEGMVAAAVRPDGTVVRGDFDLYEHAFVLLAMATARRDRPDREGLRGEAEALLERMRAGWAHPAAGFEEARPRTLPLRSNPHMHLLEAALAWSEISTGLDRRRWQELADELVHLCLTRFIDADSGALREHFDGDWKPLAGPAGALVEPGHQFEWAWLLMRWGRGSAHPKALAAARRLLDIGETQGVDRRRGVAVDALGDGLRIVEGSARLWPQTERIKAWHAAARDGDGASTVGARVALDAALRGLSLYLLDSPPGLWHEQIKPDGSFALQHCRASSLYHIACAIDAFCDDDPAPAPSAQLDAGPGRSAP